MSYFELEKIIRDFLKDDNFNQLCFLKHHNSSRLIHTLNVTICSYRFAKRFNLDLDYTSLVRGCMLHDFFLYQQYSCPEGKIHAWYHPKEAYKNACKYFDVNDIEKDMILNHMFPLSIKPPKYKETIVLVLCDKYCATVERFFHKNYLVEIKSKEKRQRDFVRTIKNLRISNKVA